MNILYSNSDYYFKPTLVSIYSLLKNTTDNHTIAENIMDLHDPNYKQQ